MANDVQAAPAPEAFNIYRPTYGAKGLPVALDLVETYHLGPSGERPPIGARLLALQFETGIAHLCELVALADAPDGLRARAAAAAQAETEEAAAATAAQEAAARDRIAALTDPEGYARAQAAAAIEAEHAALAPFASPEEAKALDAVKAERLAALEPPAAAEPVAAEAMPEAPASPAPE